MRPVHIAAPWVSLLFVVVVTTTLFDAPVLAQDTGGGAWGPKDAPWEKYGYPRKKTKRNSKRVVKGKNSDQRKQEQKFHVEYYDKEKQRPKIWYQYYERIAEDQNGKKSVEHVLHGDYAEYLDSPRIQRRYFGAAPQGDVTLSATYDDGRIRRRLRFPEQPEGISVEELFYLSNGAVQRRTERYNNWQTRLIEETSTKGHVVERITGQRDGLRTSWKMWRWNATSKENMLVYSEESEYYLGMADILCKRFRSLKSKRVMTRGGRNGHYRLVGKEFVEDWTIDRRGKLTIREDGTVTTTGRYTFIRPYVSFEKTLPESPHCLWPSHLSRLVAVAHGEWKYYDSKGVVKTEVWNKGVLEKVQRR